MRRMELQRFPTADELADRAAELILDSATKAVALRGRFVWALAGGQTPRATYARLTQADLSGRFPWRDTFIVWTDERCVPPDDPGSNYRMVREMLLDRAPVPADNVLRIRGEDCPLAEDERYEAALRRLLNDAAGQGRIDLALLGVGADGHTASLFPGAVTLAEQRRWVVPAVGPPPYVRRITLTLPLLNASRRVVVLATGPSKAAVVRSVRVGGPEAQNWPISLVRPHSGDLVWLVDAAAFG